MSKATLTTRADGSTIHFKVPKLTKLEQWVWNHRTQSAASMASELNTSERSIWAAFTRAENKVKEIFVLNEIQGS